MSLQVFGTLGLLEHGERLGRIASARALADELVEAGLFIAAAALALWRRGLAR
jgi:predicted nucleic acid-binding protein